MSVRRQPLRTVPLMLTLTRARAAPGSRPTVIRRSRRPSGPGRPRRAARGRGPVQPGVVAEHGRQAGEHVAGGGLAAVAERIPGERAGLAAQRPGPLGDPLGGRQVEVVRPDDLRVTLGRSQPSPASTLGRNTAAL